jgi:uncharacterized membrane protein YphA (DoxX/SURF4 family)
MDTAASTPEVVEWLLVQLAAFQAALLIASGLHKLISFDRIQSAVRKFAGVPSAFAPAAVVGAAAAELLAGILLLTPSLRAVGAALAMLIWGGYLLLILRAVAQGRRAVDCGCSFGAAQRPLGAYHVVRNAALTGAALLVAAGAAQGAAVSVSGPQILAALALLALYGALDQVMALTPPRAGELL